ncbi:MAG: alpha/beta hydrolase family esterase [Thiotrichales bacterium]
MTSFELKVGERLRTGVFDTPSSDLSCVAVLIVLHGTLQRGLLVRRITRFADFAPRSGVKVLFPDALGGYWRDGLRPDDDVDDVQFIAELVRHIRREPGCAGVPVFIAGVSNGGFMVQRLLCEHPDLFAAAAVVIATMGLNQHLLCVPRSVVPLCLIAGTADPIVAHAGGLMRLRAAGGFGATNARILGFAEMVDHWRTLGGFAPEWGETRAIDGGERSLREARYAAVAGEGLWTMEVVGGGHHWFGYPIDPAYEHGFGPTSLEFDTTRYIWTFFSRALGACRT